MKKSTKPKITSIKVTKTFGSRGLSGIGAPKVPIQSKDEYNFVLGSSSTNNKDLQTRTKTLSSNNAPTASIGIL